MGIPLAASAQRLGSRPIIPFQLVEVYRPADSRMISPIHPIGLSFHQQAQVVDQAGQEGLFRKCLLRTHLTVATANATLCRYPGTEAIGIRPR